MSTDRASKSRLEQDDYVALAAFRKALRKFLHFTEMSARSAGISPQHHQVLLAIRAHKDREWASVGEIAESLQLRHNATVGLVNRCQLAGLIERSTDPEDRRVIRVSLTPYGRQVLEDITMRNLMELRVLGRLTREFEALDDLAHQEDA